MQFKPSYIPKNKRKVNYKIVVPFIVVLALGFYVLLDKFVPDIKEDKTYLICNLNANESNNLIKERKYKDTMYMDIIRELTDKENIVLNIDDKKMEFSIYLK